MNSMAIAIFSTVHEIYPTTVKNLRKMIPPVSQSCFFYVPDEFKLTIGKEQFLFIDEARVRRERFLLFCK
ncbi:unnamed protein product [Rotaria sp. Silwood2]|nr:unnamed protein product [Rotaria sp. Silwood2]CAF2847460.1 unnamed protein product [Rotaria sp. Silwood2]CAF3251041.1 unnamed protein product [Rotaria sp. Silwood2]CAF4467509.1 unnamed protein product [Rotaria sp. Silwood2]